jgi:isoquinoline 1-oxidoreductase subunit alpha
MPNYTLQVNGKARTVDAQPDEPLLWVLREQLQLTGTKFGCGIAACGACTVLLDGKAVRSCSYPASAVGAAAITTIEGLSPNRSHPVQQAWIEKQVPQCGYCQSGMILTAVALLREKPKPTDKDIDESMLNLCRCGTYVRVREAIHAASKVIAILPAAAPGARS